MGEHLSHDVEPTPDVIELRQQLDELFAESDRQVARLLFRFMQDE
jgi:hypothetical protein